MSLESTPYPGVSMVWKGKQKLLLTKNLTPGKMFFRELIWDEQGVEYRAFDPRHSKIAAAFAKRIHSCPIQAGSSLLYLGAAHGYTASFLSDIVGKNGVLYCVDMAPRVVRDLYLLCEQRENMQPILADANKPDLYAKRITPVDIIVQDVAARMQVPILFKNLQFLKPKGYVLFSVKARSIDVTKKPSTIFQQVEEQLKDKLKVLEKVDLGPFEKDHVLFLCQKK